MSYHLLPGACNLPHLGLRRWNPHLCHCLLPLQLWIPAGRRGCLFSIKSNPVLIQVGYVYTETEGYDICWTMPHCVLSLKLIGLTFDCYDGERARRLGEGVLSKDQRKSFLPDNPSLLEMLSHRFYLTPALHKQCTQMPQSRSLIC